ncbi:DUF484 family protein [Magnetococcus sp. PR-3]|uniref:DUF484 family protein n=1 Tax=Magnetococcus sp. PR-3 TaxID=3120355 RepID=UPI002FCDE39F
MNEAAIQPIIDGPLTEKQVRDYLLANPSFFNSNEDLLPAAINASGRVLSLEASQLNKLHQENSRIQEHMDQIMERIRQNDAIYHAFHTIQKTLLVEMGRDVASLINRFCDALEDTFKIYRVALTISDTAPAMLPLRHAMQSDPALAGALSGRVNLLDHAQLQSILGNSSHSVIRVGREGGDRTPFFGLQAEQIKSDALIPIFTPPLDLLTEEGPKPEPIASLNLGGETPNRFLPGYSTDLLQDMTDIFVLILERTLEAN